MAGDFTKTPAMQSPFVRDVRGFTLVELLVVVAVIAIVAGIAVPSFRSSSEQIRLASATREVERVLQIARMKAVRADRVMRVRFNCPVAGQYRMVELLGTIKVPAADDADGAAATRCSVTNYPYPDTNPEFFAVPNNDGPLKDLPPNVVFDTVQTIDFWPNGTAHTVGASAPIAGDLTLSLRNTKLVSTYKKSITVNGLGKIALQ
jgi:prepilin-type N-terminal cleavage/methylation domain-containing protein